MHTWEPDDPAQPGLDLLGGRETRRANAALRDYLRMGPTRNLEALLAGYAADRQAPTRRAQMLKAWSIRYDWPERAELYDELQRMRAAAGEAERQRQALQTGLALSAGRVENLKQLYDQMQVYLVQAWPVWIADLQGGSVDASGAERSSRVPRFNTGILIQMRGILDDLARETGGRASLPLMVNAPSERGAGEIALPNLKLLTPEELETLDRLIQKSLPPGAPGPLWQPSLPGFMD